MENPMHLGDGAYITFTAHGFLLTANHHDPVQASDTVAIELVDAPKLVAFIQESLGGKVSEAHVNS